MHARIAILTLAALAGSASADTIYWSTNPPDTLWGNAANWEGGHVPGVNDLAVIRPGAGPLVTGFTPVGGLYVQPGASVTVVSQLYVYGGASIQGSMSIAGQPAVFYHRDDVNLEGRITIWGGAEIERAAAGSGIFTVRSSGSILVPAYDTVGVTLGTALQVEGTVDVRSPHPVYVGPWTFEHNAVSYIALQPSGTLRFSQSGSVAATFPAWQQPPYIVNTGLIDISGLPSDVVDFGASLGVLNGGLVAVDRPDIHIHRSLDITVGGDLSRGQWGCIGYGRIFFDAAVTGIGQDASVRYSGFGSTIVSPGPLLRNAGHFSADLGGALVPQVGGGEFVNHGVIDLDPTSYVRVEGRFTNAPDGAVNTWVAGAFDGQHSVVLCDAATLSGTLNARFAGWYTPAKGDRILTVSTPSTTGAFTSVTTAYTSMPFSPVYDQDGMSLLAGCATDFNGDNFVDFFDYDDFVACFETGACPPGKTADFNSDGFVDFFDYDDFVASFESGC